MRDCQFVVVLWVAALLGNFVPYAHSQDQEDAQEEAVGGQDALASATSEYLTALDNAAVVERSLAHLGLRLALYPSAWERWAIERLQTGWSMKRSTDEIAAELRADRKTQRLLADKAMIRLELVHPGVTEPDSEVAQPVHLMIAELSEALQLRAGGVAVAWKPLRAPVGLEVTRVRVGKQNTVKNGQLVPFISPLKPDRSRAVFRGPRASFEGVLPSNAFDKKHGRLTAGLSFDEFHGLYEDPHLINLNKTENTFERDQSLELEIALPLFFPSMPAALRTLLDGCKEK